MKRRVRLTIFAVLLFMTAPLGATMVPAEAIRRARIMLRKKKQYKKGPIRKAYYKKIMLMLKRSIEGYRRSDPSLWYTYGAFIHKHLSPHFRREYMLAFKRALKGGLKKREIYSRIAGYYSIHHEHRTSLSYLVKAYEARVCNAYTLEKIINWHTARRQYDKVRLWVRRLLHYTIYDRRADLMKLSKKYWIVRAYSLHARMLNLQFKYAATARLLPAYLRAVRGRRLKHKLSYAPNGFYVNLTKAYYYLALRAFGKKNLRKALYYAGRSVAAKKKASVNLNHPKSQIDFLYQAIRLKMRYAHVKPEAVQRILVLFISRVNLPSIIPEYLTASEYHRVYKFAGTYHGYDRFLRRYYRHDRTSGKYLLDKRESRGKRAVLYPLFNNYKENFPGRARRNFAMKPREIRRGINTLNAMRAVFEGMSHGKMSMHFTIKTIDAAYTSYHSWRKPWHEYIKPFPSSTIYRHTKKHDTIWFIYKGQLMGRNGYGGAATHPIIPFQLYSPLRGTVVTRIDYPEMLSGWGMSLLEFFMHEYFHSIEWTWGLTPHRWRFSGLRRQYRGYGRHSPFQRWLVSAETREYPYYHYILSRHIPGRARRPKRKGDSLGWRKLLFADQFPFRMTGKTYRNHLNSIKSISPNLLLKARELRKQADKAWKKKKYREAIFLAEKANILNPGSQRFHYWKAHQAEKARTFDLALKHYRQYLKFNDSWWIAYKVALWLHYKYKRPGASLPYYQNALRFAGQVKHKRAIRRHYQRAIKAAK